MANYDSSLTVRTNGTIKERAKKIYEDLGLDLSTAVNVFLRKSIEYEGFPFEVRRMIPSEELLEAIREADEIAAGKKKVKTYSDYDEMMEDLLSE